MILTSTTESKPYEAIPVSFFYGDKYKSISSNRKKGAKRRRKQMIFRLQQYSSNPNTLLLRDYHSAVGDRTKKVKYTIAKKKMNKSSHNAYNIWRTMFSFFVCVLILYSTVAFPFRPFASATSLHAAIAVWNKTTERVFS